MANKIREIKFRAWDKEVRVMGLLKFIDFYEDGNISGCKFIYNYNKEEQEFYYGYEDNMEDINDLEIMQFTGLKDKNGKEIYEGDIVSGIMPDSECDETFKKMVVKYEEDGFAIYRPDETINAKSGLYFGSLISCTLNKCIEVIGNIYENGDFLKCKV